jgi:hypothetical protein
MTPNLRIFVDLLAETLYLNDAKRLTGVEAVWPRFPDFDPDRWADYRREARDILAWLEDAIECTELEARALPDQPE